VDPDAARGRLGSSDAASQAPPDGNARYGHGR
jgi:hypothetical protein